VAASAHPAAQTGWGRALVAGEALRAEPDAAATQVATVASSMIAGRVQRVALGPAGDVWVRMAFPDAVRGWAPGAAIAAVAPPPAIAPEVRRALTRRTASVGPHAALVVRDPYGRTLFAAGTREELILASVTKVVTVAAALQAGPLSFGAARAILGPSDNDRAQALSTGLGGGSAALGARRAQDAAAALGATVRLADGSGLSRTNRASAGEVADLLLALRETERFRPLFRGLPVAGRSGTLRWRMTGTAAAGRLRAKTGTLSDPPASSALAGYLWPHGAGPAPERALIVVMLANRVAPARVEPVHDANAAALAAPGALQAPPPAALRRRGVS
jgi:D-alanyl-D-alanine carboxypeptidase/D-alanyl-D-alanine-endopeptidase (penicillin-binding protein 4)